MMPIMRPSAARRLGWQFAIVSSYFFAASIGCASVGKRIDSAAEMPVRLSSQQITQMVQKALAAFGMPAGQAKVVTARLTPREQQLPYILDEQPVLRIRIQTGALMLKVDQEQTVNPLITSWDLFYSPKSHQLIKAVSVWPAGVTEMKFPSLAVEEREMKRISELFLAIPTDAPKITAVDAISKAMATSEAKQIIVYYVIDAFRDPKPGSLYAHSRAVWIVQAWGIPPLHLPIPEGASPASIAANTLDHLRTRIDAKTGELLDADSTPQSE
jgi:hypothetical protein